MATSVAAVGKSSRAADEILPSLDLTKFNLKEHKYTKGNTAHAECAHPSYTQLDLPDRMLWSIHEKDQAYITVGGEPIEQVLFGEILFLWR